MASINELKNALKDHLEEKGVLNQIRSSLRNEIFSTINDKTVQVPKPSNENYLINELIREYLDYNNYNYTNSTFETESGNDKNALERNFVSRQLGVLENEDTRSLPLIYSLVFGRKEKLAEQSVAMGQGGREEKGGKNKGYLKGGKY